ncbi:MAG: hypothetical protein GXP38_05040 [Chloroflexi bacterium]|nr:hypothetical protein [Chloroflexota bacterium]
MASCEKDWIDIMQSLLVPTIAVLGVWIAWQQWNTNRLRLRHELFDRRFKLYEEILGLFGEITRKSSTKSIDALEFCKAAQLARFLFDKDIHQFMDKAVMRLSDLETIEAELDGLPKEDQRYPSLALKKREARDWFHDELLTLDDRFDKHMCLAPRPFR